MRAKNRIAFPCPDDRIPAWHSVPEELMFEPFRTVEFTLLSWNQAPRLRWFYKCSACGSMRTSSFDPKDEIPEDVMEEMLVHVQMSHEVTRSK